MANTDNIRDLLERYFRDELTESERQEVNSRREMNPDFAQAFQEYELLFEALAEEKVIAFRQMVQEEGQAYQQNHSDTIAPVRKLFGMPYSYAIAAAVVMLVMVGWWVLSPDNAQSSDQLYAQYYQAYDLIDPQFTRGGDSTKTAIDSSWVSDYQKGAYKACLEKLNGFDSLSTEMQFIQGMCHLQLKDYAQAVSSLQALSLQSGEYAETARWYLALAYMKTQQAEQSKALLTQIAQSDGPAYNKSKARELMDKLP